MIYITFKMTDNQQLEFIASRHHLESDLNYFKTWAIENIDRIDSLVNVRATRHNHCLLYWTELKKVISHYKNL